MKEQTYVPSDEDDVKKEYELAEKAYRMGTEEEAETRFKTVLRHDTRNFGAHLRLAQYYRRHDKIAEAKKHWNRAKASRPEHPLVWTLAGTTYFESYLWEAGNAKHDDGAVALDKAIVDLKRARQLANKAFDCFQEQYCACLLAICYFARAGGSDDLTKAQEIKDELDQWPPLSRITEVLVNILTAFEFAATHRQPPTGDSEPAQEAIQRAKESLERLKQNQDARSFSREDRTEALIGAQFLEYLVDEGQRQLKAVTLRLRRSR